MEDGSIIEGVKSNNLRLIGRKGGDDDYDDDSSTSDDEAWLRNQSPFESVKQSPGQVMRVMREKKRSLTGSDRHGF